MRSKFPCFVLRPREPSVQFCSLAESPAVCVTNDWWETGRGGARGARERERRDMGWWPTTMDQAEARRCFSPGCGSADDRCFRLGNASLQWVCSVPAEQREPNQTTSKSPPPTPPTWIPACVLPADGALLFYMHITVTFRDRCAHKNPLPPPRACKCARTGGEDRHSYSHQACAVLGCS